LAGLKAPLAVDWAQIFINCSSVQISLLKLIRCETKGLSAGHDTRSHVYMTKFKVQFVENSSFQGVSEANLHTFLHRFSLGKFDCLWKALGMAKLPSLSS